MFTTFHAIVLGIVEGLTEFLPISSTGHMILAAQALGISGSAFRSTFEVVIQIGAIAAVVVLYWKRILSNFSLIKKLIVAFIPTGVIGLVFYKILKTYLLGNTLVVVITLILGGIIIVLFEKIWVKNAEARALRTGKTPITDVNNISYKQSFLVGLFQSIAIIPGVSRSAATIIGGELLGISRVAIVEFSFMLAIPTMIAATGLSLVKESIHYTSYEYMMLAIGTVVSFVVALFAIKTFLSYVQKNSLAGFGYYRILVGIVFFLIFFV